MIKIVTLQQTLNPISAQERVKVNQNWDAIVLAFSQLQLQVNFLAGGTEVDQIIARINAAIALAETGAQDAIDSVNNNYAERVIEINQGLNDLSVAVTNSVTATNEAIQATNDAKDSISQMQNLINGFVFLGQYDVATNYIRNNMVYFDGATYIALRNNVNIPVSNTDDWSLFADRGQRGEKGDVGDTGASLSIQGSLTDASQLPATGMSGQAYTVGNDDTRNLYVWSENTMSWQNVGNIKGEKGDRGEKGDTGNDASVTSANITNALGYRPANDTDLTNLDNNLTTHLEETTPYDITTFSSSITIDRSVDNVIRFNSLIASSKTSGANFIAENGDININRVGLYQVTFSITNLEMAKHTFLVRNAQNQTILKITSPNGCIPLVFYLIGTSNLVQYSIWIEADNSIPTTTIYADSLSTLLTVRKVV